MVTSILGTRIRQRRREVGMTQVHLATTVDISASYLNLIEWNKRPIAGSLLRKVADALDISLAELDNATEHHLSATLSEIARLPTLSALQIEEHRTNELIGRFPGWARGVAALARSERAAAARVQVLSDRLNNDPFLSETMHHMLTRIAAIRSATEILTDYELATDRRAQFNAIVHEESQALSKVGESLATYLDKAEESEHALKPVDELEALFNARANHIAELEEAAQVLSAQVSGPRPRARMAHARSLAEAELSPLIETLIGEQPEMDGPLAEARVRRALIDYAASAMVMPMSEFAQRADTLRYDIEALAEVFSADIESVSLRLTALAIGKDVPKFGYFCVNAAGTVIEMRSIEQLAVPRYASACPLWVLYRAQQSPETFIRQRVVFPSGARFVFVARAVHHGAAGFGKPRHYQTVMTAMSEDDARKTVYAPDPNTSVEEVGPGCRLCPLTDCLHRVDAPLSE